MKITGKDAKEFKEMYSAILSMLEGEEKKIMTDLLDGKTVSIKQGDDVWETLMDGDEILTVILDEAKGTFTPEE